MHSFGRPESKPADRACIAMVCTLGNCFTALARLRWTIVCMRIEGGLRWGLHSHSHDISISVLSTLDVQPIRSQIRPGTRVRKT